MKGDVICWQLASRRGRGRAREGGKESKTRVRKRGKGRHSQGREGRGRRKDGGVNTGSNREKKTKGKGEQQRLEVQPPALRSRFFPSYFPKRFGSGSLSQPGAACPRIPALPLPAAAVAPAKVPSPPGRSGTLEPEVKNKREEKNGLQARGRNQGNQALNVIKGLYLGALKQNTQA